MAGSSAPGAPLSVLVACAPEDAPAVAALAQRLSADGLQPSLMSSAMTARALRDAVAAASTIVICLSRRAALGGRLATVLANLLEIMVLAPNPRRLTLVLKLTSCEAPPALASLPTLELFSARAYDDLLARLRAHAEAIAPAPAAPPEPEPPPAPSLPALVLRGAFVLPQLERQGQLRRLGRGVARDLLLLDGRHALVVTGGGPTLVRLSDGQPLWAIDCPARCAALSPSGRLLALAAGAQIFLWDLADGSLRGVCAGHGDAVSGLAFAPDERTLASASLDRSVRLWRTGDDGRAPALLTTLPDRGPQLLGVAFNHDGTLLAAGGADRSVLVWRTLDRARIQTLTGHGGPVEALAFGPELLVVAARGRQAGLWDTRTWRRREAPADHDGAIEAIAISADGSVVATGATDHRVHLFRLDDGTTGPGLRAHGGPVTALAFSQDGAELASAGEDERLLVTRVADGTQLAGLRPFSARVASLAVSPDGALLAVGGASGALTVYSLDEEGGARLRQSEHRGPVSSVTFAGPEHVVTASGDRTLRRWSLREGASQLLLQTQGALHAACLAPGAGLLASSDGESTVQLWRLAGPGDTPGGVFWRVLRGLKGRPRLIGFGPRAELVAVSSEDGAVQLWRLDTLAGERADPELKLSFDGGLARSMAISADGGLIAVGGDGGAVKVWRTTGGAEVGSLQGAGPAATSLAFAPDGRALAVGDARGTIAIWRIGPGDGRRRPPGTLLAHAGAVQALAFCPSGQLVSGSTDGTVRIWRV